MGSESNLLIEPAPRQFNPTPVGWEEIFDYVSAAPLVNNPVVIDIRKRANFADAFVICDVESISALRNLAQQVKKHFSYRPIPNCRPIGGGSVGTLPLLSDSTGNDWMIVDFGRTLLHLFLPETRLKYNLEELWTLPAVSNETVLPEPAINSIAV